MHGHNEEPPKTQDNSLSFILSHARARSCRLSWRRRPRRTRRLMRRWRAGHAFVWIPILALGSAVPRKLDHWRCCTSAATSRSRIMPCCIAGEVRDERQGEDCRHRRGRGPHHGPDLHDRGADGHERSPEHGDQELGGGDREESGSVRCWRTVHEQLFHLFNRKQSYFASQMADKDWNFVVRYEDVV